VRSQLGPKKRANELEIAHFFWAGLSPDNLDTANLTYCSVRMTAVGFEVPVKAALGNVRLPSFPKVIRVSEAGSVMITGFVRSYLQCGAVGCVSEFGKR